MNQIQIWQLLVDIGLITSVLFMTTRAFKSTRLSSMLPKTRELEASLRTLIGEAEQAGLDLNDQLLRREQNIQRALGEMKECEARIMKALAEGDVLHGKLQTTRSETIRLIQDLKAGFEQGIQTEMVRYDESAHGEKGSTGERISQSVASASSGMTSRQALQPSTPEAFAQQSYTAAPPKAPQKAPSREPVRSAVSSTSQGTQNKAAELKRVYESAEVMLKQGKGVETIASEMKIPVEGVKLLAQMIEIERDEDSRRKDSYDQVTTDSRLGALAGIRRQTSVL